MKEIYYPDGTIGITNRVITNPRYSSTHTIIVDIDGERLKIGTGFKGIKAKDILPKHENKTMKDKSGKKVMKVQYDKTTGRVITSGTTYKYINSDKKEVTKDEVQYFIDEDGKEVPVREFEQTKIVDIKKMIPRASLDDYIFSSDYEVVPENEKDKWELWQLADYLDRNNLVATGAVVTRKGWQKYGVMFVPIVDRKKGTFSILAKLTQKKLKMESPQTIPKEKFVESEAGKTLDTDVEELF